MRSCGVLVCEASSEATIERRDSTRPGPEDGWKTDSKVPNLWVGGLRYASRKLYILKWERDHCWGAVGRGGNTSLQSPRQKQKFKTQSANLSGRLFSPRTGQGKNTQNPQVQNMAAAKPGGNPNMRAQTNQQTKTKQDKKTEQKRNKQKHKGS